MTETFKIALYVAAALTLWLPGLSLAQTDGEPPLPLPRPDGLDTPLAEQHLPTSQTPEPVPDPEIKDTNRQGPDADAGGEIDRVYQAACPALLTGRVVGEMVAPLSEGTCGLASPFAISALVVNGHEIGLSGTPIVNCAMATTLADWAQEVDRYASAALDTQIESLVTGPGYQCRLRNNTNTGFVSEHGLGNGADISGVNLADGSQILVSEDRSVAPLGPKQKFLGFAHAAACGRFTTVLGPEANSEHADHFHFDLGCHGQSCTAQICE